MPSLFEYEPVVEIPPLLFDTFEIDPPWKHKNPGGMHGANQRKGTRPKYPTMTFEELKRFQLPAKPAARAHIWCWATSEHLALVDPLIEVWGFRPTGAMRVWHKTQPTNGYWWGGDAEYARLGTTGEEMEADVEYARLGVWGLAYRANAKAILGYHPRSIFTAPRKEGHSSKPDLFYLETAAISPGPNRLSIFQRYPRDGWWGWGNEYEGPRKLSLVGVRLTSDRPPEPPTAR